MAFDRRRDDRWTRFPTSTPRTAEGGVSTSKQRGAMADSWWSKRFVDVLEGLGLGARMQRGRRYARTGQVLHVDVTAGLIAAQVQGSRARPYLVTVARPEASTAQWNLIEAAMRERVGFVARLSAGEVPEELEAVFAAAGTTLLPSAWKDLRATCSCPDWENPCKHIAAVLYVFADQLDADPWLLLAWRGRTRDDVLGFFSGGLGLTASPPPAPWWPFPNGSLAGASTDDAAVAPPGPPPDPAAVLGRLEPLRLAVGTVAVADLLAAAYLAVATGTEA